MIVIVYANDVFDEEAALSVDGEIVLQGDYYHDKIIDQIYGFLTCLQYLGSNYSYEEQYLKPEDELFNRLNFFNPDEGDNDNEE